MLDRYPPSDAELPISTRDDVEGSGVSTDAPPREYRAVERVFSLGRFQKLCKPGSSGSPSASASPGHVTRISGR